MATRRTTITSATTTEIATCNVPSGKDFYLATIGISGTFGGTSVALQWSPDGGTTKITLLDPFSGSAFAATNTASTNIQLGEGTGLAGQLKLYAVTTGGSGISVNVDVCDNT